MSIRIGIAGFGRHAAGRILPVIEALGELSLAAVWTRSAETAERLRARGLAAESDFARFLGTDMDIVYVASPSGLHAVHAQAVLEAGRHAWVEKPLAATLEDTRRLVDLAAGRGLMLTEAFMFPWHAQAGAVHQALAAGAIGSSRHASFTFCFPHLHADDFRYDPQLGGGAFLDHACYLVKALDLYLGGEWEVLGGCADHAGRAVDVSGAALLRRAADGVTATLQWGFGRSYVNEIRFIGERGRMLVESAFTKPASRGCGITVEDSHGARSVIDVAAEDPYRRMIEGFTRQYRDPDCWPDIRQEILAHADRCFTLHSRLRFDR